MSSLTTSPSATPPGPRHISRSRLAACGLLLALAPLAPLAALPDPFFDVSVGCHYDDNQNRARPRSDQRADMVATARVVGGWGFDVGTASRLMVTAGVDGELWDRFGRLDQVQGLLSLVWRSKLGLGPTAPTLRLAAEAQAVDSRSALRSGTGLVASARLGRRFGDRFEGALSYFYEHRDADSAAFDHRAHSLLGSLAADLGEASTFTLRYQARQGDVTSVAAPNPLILAAAEVRDDDDAYGQPGWIAYRLDATTHVLSLGLDSAISDHAAVDVRWERQYTDTEEEGLAYGNNVLRFAYRLGF
jgi:hypothetical protein